MRRRLSLGGQTLPLTGWADLGGARWDMARLHDPLQWTDQQLAVLGVTAFEEPEPLPPPDPLRVAYRAAGIDPDNPPSAEVDETATPFQQLAVGTFYPDGYLIDVGGTTYAVSRGGFWYGAWDAQTLINLNHLVPAEPPEPGPGGVPAWQAGVAYTLPAQVTHNGTTYNLVQPHTAQAGWEPPNVPALWSPA